LRVTGIEQGNVKTVTLTSGEAIRTRTLIVATGARWRELGVPGERENIGNGVAYCPHCDGPFFKGRDVAVIGGGNSGIEAALDLAGIVHSVTVLEFLPQLKADQVLIDQAIARDNITLMTNVATKQIIAEHGKVVAIEYEDRETGEIRQDELAGVFIQIGLVPNSQVMEGVVELSQYGEIVVDEKCRTSEPGIYACGDVTTVPYKQIVVAMGEGLAGGFRIPADPSGGRGSADGRSGLIGEPTPISPRSNGRMPLRIGPKNCRNPPWTA
jgi:alkyl hydroperoxide reductase subunit F